MTYFTQKTSAESNILITCEHGSSHIPAKHANLGLTMEDLQNAEGDWYDIGALPLAEALCEKLDSSLLAATISRLFVDPNRRLDANIEHPNSYHTAILKTELLTVIDGKEKHVPVPGNIVPDHDTEEARRWNKYVLPYQERGFEIVSEIQEKYDHAWLFQVHSFSPLYNGEKRTIDIDVMFDKSEKEAQLLMDWLQNNSDYAIGSNSPWAMRDTDGGVFGPIQSERAKLLGFDVNSNHLQDKKGIEKIADLLAKAIRVIVSP